MSITKITIDGTEYELKAIPKTAKSEKPTPEQALLNIIEGTVNHFDENYPESVFWMKDGKVLFELDFKNKYLWVSYSDVWCVFEQEYNMSYEDTQDFIKAVVERRFKILSLTTVKHGWYGQQMVERRFKK